MRAHQFRRRPIRWLTAAAVAAAWTAGPALAAAVQFPVGNSLGLAPPFGLRADSKAPGFHDPENKVTMLVLELPRPAYFQIESSMTTAAAKKQGVVIDHRELLLTDAGPALVSAGDDIRNDMRRWMLVALTPEFTAVVSVQIPNAARKLYPDAAIRTALASLTTRTAPIEEQLSILPYTIEERAGFRVVAVLNRNTVVLTGGPQDDIRTADQPHIVIGVSPSGTPQEEDRAKLAHVVFGSLPGFADRRITMSEMLRVEGQPVYEIRADARYGKSGTPVTVVQWLRFGRSSYLQIVGVTAKDTWSRDFPRFRAVRDGIEPRR
jgi:hypothetical protein